jgi:cholesterol transport system auxiliary component
LRRAHEIEYFAVHQWVDTPAKMLAPLMLQALQHSGAFRAVALAPTGASGDLRLETELIRLQQDFTQSPSRVQLALRAMLIDTATRRVLAWREFNISTVSASDDPYGGAAAASVATRQMLLELVAFLQSPATLNAQAASALRN